MGSLYLEKRREFMIDNQPKVASEPSVLLVSLPWTSLTEPSLGLGILRSVLDKKTNLLPCLAS